MEEFVHPKTLERLRSLLAKVTDERLRDQLKRLMADVEAKGPPLETASPRY